MNQSEHILTCLSEECVEVSKDIHKALRFGLDDRNVLNPTGPTNRERIVVELNDLFALVDMAVQEGIIPYDWLVPSMAAEKCHKVRKFMTYAKSVGALNP